MAITKPNATLVKAMLNELNIKFIVFDSLPPSSPEGLSVLQITFVADAQTPKWILILFVHELDAVIYSYAHIQHVSGEDLQPALMTMINLINHHSLLEVHLDYSLSGKSVRVRSAMRTPSRGVPANEFGAWFDRHLIRADYLSRIFNVLDLSPKDQIEALESARETVRAHLGMESDPEIA